MGEIIPWDEWMEIIRPYYYKNITGRSARGIEVMLRMYLLQIWYNLSDEGMEDAIYDSYAFRTFMKKGCPSKDTKYTETDKVNELKYIIVRKDAKIKVLEMENDLCGIFLANRKEVRPEVKYDNALAEIFLYPKNRVHLPNKYQDFCRSETAH